MFKHVIKRKREARLQRTLESHDSDQRERFDLAAPDFERRYRALSAFDMSRFLSPTWGDFNAKVEEALLPVPSFDFLRDRTLRHTMFVNAGGEWLEGQLSELRAAHKDDVLETWLREDPVGAPKLKVPELLTSHNRVHHASHLERHERHRKGDLFRSKRVVEWGGGYGGLARLFLRRSPSTCTYMLVDTPLFSCLQWLYLQSVLGPSSVHHLMSRDDTLQDGKVNIITVGLLDTFGQQINAEAFISTWAISESAVAAQDLVVDSDWFGAKHLLLAYQSACEEFPDAGRMGELASAAGAELVPVPHIAGSHYAFR